MTKKFITKAKARILYPVERRLYWAYGSNLNIAAMKDRCPNALPYRQLYVNHGQLVFRGVADVEAHPSAGCVVAGALWKITRECEARLDRYEGYRDGEDGLYSKKYLTISDDGKVKRVLFYKMNSEGVHAPWESYLNQIIQGYRDFDLDLDLLEAALQRSWENADKTPDLRRRWENKGRPSLAKALGVSYAS